MSPDARSQRVVDGVVALGLYAVLLALMRVQIPPVQAPGYVLILGFDAVQNALAPGLGGGAFQVALGGYLLGLAGLAGVVGGRLRRRFGPGGVLRYGIVGALVAFVGYALVIAVVIATSSLPAGWSPVVVALAVAAAGLWTGSRLGARHRRTEEGR